jgi:hypothetical protein
MADFSSDGVEEIEELLVGQKMTAPSDSRG